MLRLYNSLSRKVEKFKPITDKKVHVYACGPTVYYFAHIGNLRSYLNEDIILRVIRHDGYHVKHVMNITDVGHLVGDGNIGEDKVMSTAKEQHKTAKEIANFYTKHFLDDFERLNIVKPDEMPKATEHIREMLELIKKLDEKGYTYVLDNGVYFDTSKFKDYGKLMGMTFKELINHLKAGARVERIEGLENPSDFAVWRFAHKDQKEMVWESPWGRGFPGWHIECSAMSMKYLGEHFDLHFGGIDHLQIHHPNEIAQSEAATEHKFVNYWMHMNFLTVDGNKMSKSLRNIYTVQELIEKGFPPTAIRLFMISGHYRQQLNFTFDALKNAERTLKIIYAFIERTVQTKSIAKNPDSIAFKKKVGAITKEFFARLDDDINMPEALAQMHTLINETNLRASLDKLNKSEAKAVIVSMLEMDEVLGLGFAEHISEEKKPLDKEIQKLVDEREDARARKDFKTADKIRGKLKEKYHIVLEDTKDGVVWRTE